MFKGVYTCTCILFKHSEAPPRFAQVFVHYLFFNMGQVKLSMDKYVVAIYLSLGKYKHLLFSYLCVRLNMVVVITTHALVSAHQEYFQSYIINTAF